MKLNKNNWLIKIATNPFSVFWLSNDYKKFDMPDNTCNLSWKLVLSLITNFVIYLFILSTLITTVHSWWIFDWSELPLALLSNIIEEYVFLNFFLLGLPIASGVVLGSILSMVLPVFLIGILFVLLSQAIGRGINKLPYDIKKPKWMLSLTKHGTVIKNKLKNISDRLVKVKNKVCIKIKYEEK